MDVLIIGKCSECGGNVFTSHKMVMREDVLMWCDNCGACRNREGHGLPVIEMFEKGAKHDEGAKP